MPASRKPKLEHYNNLLADLATHLLETVRRGLKKTTWSVAYIDARGADDGDGRLSKLRVQLPNGEVIKSLHAPMVVGDRLDEIWKIKDKVFPERWFGIKITVYPDGRCEAEFNYDPKCAGDPEFFDAAIE